MEEKKDIFDFIEKRPIETPGADYFKSLADKVISDVAEEPEEIKTKVIPLHRRPAVWLSGVAAAILVAFLMLPDETINVDPVEITFDDLSKKEVLAYVDENIEDFDEELLMEFIAADNLKINTAFEPNKVEDVDPIETMVETETKDLQESLESISNQEILEYLEEEGFGSEDEDDDLFF
ncbi:MAG: hypothetical protein Crog4KO_10190 [Crocinitomicaceae bacterium]